MKTKFKKHARIIVVSVVAIAASGLAIYYRSMLDEELHVDENFVWNPNEMMRKVKEEGFMLRYWIAEDRNPIMALSEKPRGN